MKILLTADPTLPVPPQYYGGIERIVDQLAGGYAAAGHEVILVAHPESTCTHAVRRYGWPGKRAEAPLDTLRNARFLRKVFLQERPDVVHSFSRLFYLYGLIHIRQARIVQSYQRAISIRSTALASFWFGRRLQYTACAAHLYRNLPRKERFTAIYNFTDTDFFTPAETPGADYLLFLGRIEPIKGVDAAIEAARMAQMRLIIAGNIPAEHQQYFDQVVRPHLAPGVVEYVGPVDDTAKRELYRNARAFLFPIRWEEPFGIVLAESMACGTPVIGFRRGSVPEVIRHGMDGYICDTVPEMADAITKVSTINRSDCRRSAVERFSTTVAAKHYLKLLHECRQS